MKITFLGGADEVGASCLLVEIAGKRLLVDAGIRISPKSSRGLQASQLPDLQPVSALGGPDFIIVTHAHTDHTGALPLVVERYPQVPVLMTRPTQVLTRVLQQDAQRIMQSRQEEEGELPLFDQVAVDLLMDAVQEVEFNQPIRLGEDLELSYYVAGHIAGAGQLVLQSSEGTLVISGDVSKSPQRTVGSVQVPPVRADALILESTYGGRMHANRDAEEKRLIERLARVIERGGRALIPAFALGRAQEVLQILLAYRDQVNAPVYVDGMVRSVCNAYAAFPDLIPPATLKAAGNDPLFFRRNIKSIRSAQERSEIAMRGEPCIIVASSGMLTGGASQFYARHLAPDERSAILLTGYQDEESPGRAMQKILRERQAGEEATLRLDKDVVPLRCEVDTYSLSAHADEQELVNLALALQPSEVMLVHGDAGARHSLASALRRRQIGVSQPSIGTQRELHFAARPWAVGRKISSGSARDLPDPEKLWEAFKDQAGSYFSARELAQAWWGDAARAAEMQSALQHPDNLFFAADWRSRSSFRVQSAEQIARARRQRAIMLANPDIVGKLVVLRNSNDQPRLGIVRAASSDSFEAEILGARGSKMPADALLWVIGAADELPPGEGMKARLSALQTAARAAQDALLPLARRRELAAAGVPVRPESLLPAPLPDGLDRLTALAGIVLALAQDGATLEQDGLKPQRAMQGEPLEQNEARELALRTFPPEARLRKVGLDVNRKRLSLVFDFPSSAQRRYASQIDALIEQSGWTVEVRPAVNQQALGALIGELLPPQARVVKGPAFFLDQREVRVEIEGIQAAEQAELAREFQAISDHRLTFDTRAAAPAPVASSPKASGNQMEINAAYARIKAALGPFGLYRTSLKQGRIVLTFISPQVGARYAEIIERLSNETGYAIEIHPHPNQQEILQKASLLFGRAGWAIRKGPGIHTDRAAISITLAAEPDAVQALQVAQDLEEQTGYTLEANW